MTQKGVEFWLMTRLTLVLSRAIAPKARVRPLPPEPVGQRHRKRVETCCLSA